MNTALDQLVECIRASDRILVIVGAGLSRPSGVPTFREDPHFWARPVEEVASFSAFQRDPLAVWSQYERMRQLARIAQPNAGHRALVTLANAKPGCLTVSQNIDELSQRSDHPQEQLVCLHGSVFDVKCSNTPCDFRDRNTTHQPTVPGLLIDPWNTRDPALSLPHVSTDNIPHCPNCASGMLRPGVVWFGETLPYDALARIDAWLFGSGSVDLALVIGTERRPFLSVAESRGAKSAFFNIFDDSGLFSVELEDGDWYVNGSASDTLPYIVDMALGKFPKS